MDAVARLRDEFTCLRAEAAEMPVRTSLTGRGLNPECLTSQNDRETTHLHTFEPDELGLKG